jgi:NAD(P)-dependent dehydrogenase (short-subunit alcohol dehydrogenase family)
LLLLFLVSPVAAASQFFLLSAIGAGGAAVAWWALFKQQEPLYMPDKDLVRDKLIVITGGTAGLGLESAKRLTAAGATVVLTSRTALKGSKAVEEVQSYLKEQNGGGETNAADLHEQIYSVTLDLDDLEGVKTFPERLQSVLGPSLEEKKIDVLMNNAGIMAVPNRETTKDGLEKTFQSNHLGHFVLTSMLFDRLATSARIINVSSEAHKIPLISGLPINDLNVEKGYGPWYCYGVSKLANVLFTKELQHRIDASSGTMKTFSLHPGVVQTDIIRNFIGTDRWDSIKKNGPSGIFEQGVVAILPIITSTVEVGASTQIYLASASDEVLESSGGEYFVDMKPASFMFPIAKDNAKAKQLWVESEKLGKVSFTIGNA